MAAVQSSSSSSAPTDGKAVATPPAHIYDDPRFFEQYQQLRGKRKEPTNGFKGSKTGERPVFRAAIDQVFPLLPLASSASGTTTAILDLGCGTGSSILDMLQRWQKRTTSAALETVPSAPAVVVSAIHITGVDLSWRMLQVAHETLSSSKYAAYAIVNTTPPSPSTRAASSIPSSTCASDRRIAIELIEHALETWQPSAATRRYHLIVSQLVLHYIVDLNAMAHRIASWLLPGGWFVFSMEHPLYTAAHGINSTTATTNNNNNGTQTSNADKKVKLESEASSSPAAAATAPPPSSTRMKPADVIRTLYGAYHRTGSRISEWLGAMVTKQHHTMTAIMMAFINAGLVMEWMDEPLYDERTEFGDDTTTTVASPVSPRKWKQALFLCARFRKPSA